MATKKPKKETRADNVGKESDSEFFKRLAKMGEEASEKASKELNSYSKEMEEFREKGRGVSKDLEEIEECKRIVEEFKVSPPVMASVNINGVSFGYSCEDSGVTKKIELLKKHRFSFLNATKSTSTFTINFKTFGRTYIKRGLQRIPLPESSEPAIVLDSNLGMGGGTALNPKNFDFMVKDGDILGTERGGYIYDIKDVKENLDDWHNNIFVFPESELRISISTDTTHPGPAFMDPSQVPEAIKRLTSSTVNTDTIMGVELIRGLFQISYLRKREDVNKLLKLPPEYPRIEFKPSSEMGLNILDEISAKAKGNLQVAKVLASIVSKHKAGVRASSGGVCGDISAFIELNRDGSLVLFNTANVVVHKNIGKEAKKVMFTTANINLRKDISEGGWPVKKITLTHNSLYETDCSKNPDPRVAAAVKISMGLGSYVTSLAEKKVLDSDIVGSIEKKMDEAIDNAANVDKTIYEEGLQRLKIAEELGADEKTIEMLKESTNAYEKRYKAGTGRKERIEAKEEFDAQKEQIQKNLEYVKKKLDGLKRQIESGLPPYNPPSESDMVKGEK